MTPIDYTKLENLEIEGIDRRDSPDFSDAFISYAEINGKKATDEELEELNDDSCFVHELVWRRLF